MEACCCLFILVHGSAEGSVQDTSHLHENRGMLFCRITERILHMRPVNSVFYFVILFDCRISDDQKPNAETDRHSALGSVHFRTDCSFQDGKFFHDETDLKLPVELIVVTDVALFILFLVSGKKTFTYRNNHNGIHD